MTLFSYTPPADIKRDRRLAAILFACSVAALFFPHAWPAALKFTMLAAGGFTATLLLPPLFARLRVSPKHAPVLSASAMVLSFFLLFAFIESHVNYTVDATLAFVVGAIGFATILFVDHVRSPLQKTPP